MQSLGRSAVRRSDHRLGSFALGLFLALAAPLAARAQAPATVKRPHVEVSLVSEAKGVRSGLPAWVALKFQIEPGWHLYWTNPGDSGLPAEVKWTLPEGWTAGALEWPTPERISVGPLMNFGFENELWLLTALNPKVSSGSTVQAKAQWLVCRETCIPGKAELSLTLPWVQSDPGFDPDFARGFSEARLAQARPWPKDQAFRAEWHPDGVDLVFQIPSDGQWEFFPDQPGWMKNPDPQGWILETDGKTRLHLQRVDASAPKPDKLSGLLVKRLGGGRSQSWQVNGLWSEPTQRSSTNWTYPKESQSKLAQPASLSRVLTMALFALVGGLLLNLMPCVFPVLGIKILGFVESAGKDPKRVRWHGLVFSLGAVASFWALLLILWILRSAGQKLGWGFQLQSPGFVAALALLFLGIGLNLLGIFEVGTRFMGVGSNWLKGKGDTLESFLSGVLATVVATPCSAPFMGAALGFALSQSLGVGFLIFTALGFGMVIPYLWLSFFPGWVRKLPRPGRWMQTLKQALAFPMFATVLWLLWVLSKQVSAQAVGQVAIAHLVLGVALWTWGKWPGKMGAQAIALALALASIGGAWRAVSGPSLVPAAPISGLAWKEFREEELKTLQAEARRVFVDFTAAWCVTCQVNERLVLSSPEVVQAFQDARVELRKADWTQKDERIAKILESHGRSGVPLYLYYDFSSGDSKPRVLPEILTPGMVLDVVKGKKP